MGKYTRKERMRSFQSELHSHNSISLETAAQRGRKLQYKLNEIVQSSGLLRKKNRGLRVAARTTWDPRREAVYWPSRANFSINIYNNINAGRTSAVSKLEKFARFVHWKGKKRCFLRGSPESFPVQVGLCSGKTKSKLVFLKNTALK